MAATRLRRGLSAVGWYVREVVGENDYDKYVAHLARTHPERTPPTRRTFERDKTDRMAANPKSRCC